MSAGTKPITLVTATPGGGKTAMVVKLMMEAQKAGRPLFVSGIPELKLEHSACPPIPEWTQLRPDPDDPSLMLPYFTFPPNSLIVLDEAQRIYRPRSAASKVPDHVAAFETVRHTGVTFILITQNPSLLDSHIRGLVGQHIHLRDVGLLGRWYYEWPEVGRVESYATAPIKKKYKLPKESFQYYKSSSLHIKRKYNIPPSMIVMIACVLLLAAAGWRLYGRFKPKPKPAPVAVKDQGKSAIGGGNMPGVPGAPKTAADMIVAETPVRPGHPESAPMYAGLLQVKDVPRVSGAIQINGEYHCYTQQGTDAGLDNMQCKAWMEHRPFDPYKEPGKDAPENAVRGSPMPYTASASDQPVGPVEEHTTGTQ